MRAGDHTEKMARWWREPGVDRADLALKGRDGAVIWRAALDLADLPAGWPGARNVRGSEARARPARGLSWPLAFLDDAEPALADRIAERCGALAVHAPPAGGRQLWLRCPRPLDERERFRVRRWLALKTGADMGSISGEHLGRLAGFRNWKRGGAWVNARRATANPAWDPLPALAEGAQGARRPAAVRPRSAQGRDLSESASEWGWVCGAIEHGFSDEWIYGRLLARCAGRRGADAGRYARRTLDAAERHVNR